MKRSLMIGRYQPFHARHEAMVRKVLRENQDAQVIIGLRDTEFSEENPYSVLERFHMIRGVFQKEIMDDQVRIYVQPDFDQLIIGRKLGWDIVEIELDEDEIPASASNLREATRGVLWITGRPSAGKTTLAMALQKRLGRSTAILDGDTMRRSISAGLTLTDQDRVENNRRIGTLARDLSSQGLTVIGATVSPTNAVRSVIDLACDPTWIYTHRDDEIPEPHNYEIPKWAISVDMDLWTPEEAAKHVMETLAQGTLK